MKRQFSSILFAVFMLNLYLGVVSGRTIDEIIASSSTAVSNFDLIGDLDGTIIRLELDMLLTVEEYNNLYERQNVYNSKKSKTSPRLKRKAIKSMTSRWTNKEIPYSFASSTFTAQEKKKISMAMKEWEDNTCITFRNAISSDSGFINFEDGSGCSSYIGMGRGKRPISLAKGCRETGVIAHEIGHAVGFYHEQNRPDRDQYINIIKENIIHPDLYSNFEKYPYSTISTYDVPYDYRSIMHYGGTAFTGNGEYTIQTIDPAFQKVIGNREGLSFLDIKLANLMYNCSENCRSTVMCPKEGFVGKDCTCWCPGNPVKICERTGVSPITERPLVKPTTRPTVRPTVKITPRPTMRPTACTDMNSLCSSWAKSGYCQISNYVKAYCKYSCAMCTDSSVSVSSCKDVRLNCPYWGKRGFCYGTYKSFMERYCPVTCDACEETTVDMSGDLHGQTDEEESNNNGVNGVSSSYFLISCAFIYCLSRF